GCTEADERHRAQDKALCFHNKSSNRLQVSLLKCVDLVCISPRFSGELERIVRDDAKQANSKRLKSSLNRRVNRCGALTHGRQCPCGSIRQSQETSKTWLKPGLTDPDRQRRFSVALDFLPLRFRAVQLLPFRQSFLHCRPVRRARYKFHIPLQLR